MSKFNPAFAAIVCCFFLHFPAQAQTYTIQTIAGRGLPAPIAATAADIGPVTGVAVDASGNLFVTSWTYQAVLRIDAKTGTMTVFAGNGAPGFSGDNGPAINAQLNLPSGIAVDSSGNVYVADYSNFRVRKISTNGVITTIAGNGTPGSTGDNGPATSAELFTPQGVAVDGAGNVYISDPTERRIREVSNGIITTIAGGGYAAPTTSPQPAASAYLDSPAGLAVDSAGDIFVALAGRSQHY